MRTWLTRWSVLTLLALAVGAQATWFAERAYACRYMRLTADERPKCCALASSDRFTRPGGDCCKHLVVDDATPATHPDLFHEVPASRVAALPPHALVPVDVARARALPPPAVERPPPIPIPTETIVLRL